MAKFLDAHQAHFVKAADSVAVLLKDHNVAHAKLLLSQYKYTRVPVIDREKNFVGVLGLGEIVEFEMAHDFFYEKSRQTRVEEIMNDKVATLQEGFTIEEVLHELVDEPFLPVLSGRKFKGIIVRQELLKSVNAMVHDFTKEYEITKRNP